MVYASLVFLYSESSMDYVSSDTTLTFTCACAGVVPVMTPQALYLEWPTHAQNGPISLTRITCPFELNRVAL